MMFEQILHLSILILKFYHSLMLEFHLLFFSSKNLILISQILSCFLNLTLNHLYSLSYLTLPCNFIKCILLNIIYSL